MKRGGKYIIVISLGTKDAVNELRRGLNTGERVHWSMQYFIWQINWALPVSFSETHVLLEIERIGWYTL